jgi:uncharacterized protein (TIGR02996 family)
MTDSDFTAAIISDPTGTAVLVLADWLEENGRGMDADYVRHGLASQIGYYPWHGLWRSEQIGAGEYGKRWSYSGYGDCRGPGNHDGYGGSGSYGGFGLSGGYGGYGGYGGHGGYGGEAATAGTAGKAATAGTVEAIEAMDATADTACLAGAAVNKSRVHKE